MQPWQQWESFQVENLDHPENLLIKLEISQLKSRILLVMSWWKYLAFMLLKNYSDSENESAHQNREQIENSDCSVFHDKSRAKW